MTISAHSRLAAIATPPIAEAQGWIADRHFPEEKPLIDLCQAVPGYPPAEELTAHLARRLSDPATHRYTDIEGLPDLRAALAADINRLYGGNIGPENVLITAGCNQAYCLALSALAEPGDSALLPLPYYFNYDMWLAMSGIERRYLAFRPDQGGVPDIDEAAAAIDRRTRALVVISPNNPTGAILSPAILADFAGLCRRRKIALVLDETYRDFLPEDRAPHDLFRDSDWARSLVHLYSFSKVFALTGYRVGAIVAGADLIREIAKIMDCLAICAPRIGQEAALFGLRQLAPWRREKTQVMRDRRQALIDAFRQANSGYEMVSSGAYFAYLRHPHRGSSAREVARRLVDGENLLSLPGAIFGPGQEDYLRLAFANVEAALMPEIANRLARDATRG